MTYTIFTEIRDTGLTKVWSVDNSNNGSHIGTVRWHGPWRKYVLLPTHPTIWSADCLQDVARFIDEQMAARKKSTAHAR